VILKIAFLSNPTVGHANYLIALATKALSQGDDICFFLPGINDRKLRRIINNPALQIPDKLENRNIPYCLLPIASSQLYRGLRVSSKRGFEEVIYALKVFNSGSKKYVNKLIELFESKKPDIIVYDYTFFPAIYVSELLNISRVAVYHSGLPFLEYPIPPIGTPYKYGQFTLNIYNTYQKIIRKEEERIRDKFYSLFHSKLKSALIEKPSGSLLNIVNTIEESEYPRKMTSEILSFCGPNIQSDIIEIKDVPKEVNKRIVYISLGTVFNKQPKLFMRIIDSIPEDKCMIIVSAGASFQCLRKKYNERDIIIKKNVNQISLLHHTDIFITHGGKNSINEALGVGVPMILFPAGGEQEYNANLVEYLHAGINFSSIQQSFGKKEMTKAIDKLLNNIKITESLHHLSQKHNKDGVEMAYTKIIDAYNHEYNL